MVRMNRCCAVLLVLGMAIGLMGAKPSTAQAGVDKTVHRIYVTDKEDVTVTESHRVVWAYAEQAITPNLFDFNWTYWTGQDIDPQTLTASDGSDKFDNLSIAEQVYLQQVTGLQADTEYYIDLYDQTPIVSTSRFEDTTSGPILVDGGMTWEITEDETSITETLTTHLYNTTTKTTYTVVESLYGDLNNTRVLTLDKEGSGTVTADPLPDENGHYPAGQAVSLTATPASGWVFSKWQIGDNTATTPETMVTMRSDISAKAYFEESPPTEVSCYALTLDKEGSGSVTADPLPGENGQYPAGQEVSLTATSAGGWAFSKWQIGENAITTPETMVTMSSNITATAYFIKISPAGGGGGGGGFSISTPSVATNDANASAESAMLNGQVTSRGGGTITAYGFSYSTDENQWTQVPVGTDNLQGSFAYNLTGLKANTEYFFRAYATNGAGTSYGQEKSFLVYQAQNPLAPLSKIVLLFYIGKNDYYVNNLKKTMDTVPVIVEDRTLLPIKYVAEPLGATVNWNPDEQKVTISLNGKTLELWIDQSTAQVNGVTVPIDPNNPAVTPIVLEPGRTMLPLRFIGEQLNCQVEWDEGQQMVTFTYPNS